MTHFHQHNVLNIQTHLVPSSQPGETQYNEVLVKSVTNQLEEIFGLTNGRLDSDSMKKT